MLLSCTEHHIWRFDGISLEAAEVLQLIMLVLQKLLLQLLLLLPLLLLLLPLPLAVNTTAASVES